MTVQVDDEDYVLYPSGTLGGKTSVSGCGKFLGEFMSDELALEFVRQHQEEGNFYPNIWKRDDHGGMMLIDYNGDEITLDDEDYDGEGDWDGDYDDYEEE